MRKFLIGIIAAFVLAACGNGISDENKKLADSVYRSLPYVDQVELCSELTSSSTEQAAFAFNGADGAEGYFTQEESEQIVDYVEAEYC
jgi:hypothetical protein